jgi:DNA primase
LTEGRFPLQSQIVNHYDPEVCSTAVDILTMDDNYVESAIWSQKDMRSLNESQMLSSGIPKLMMLYKSRLVSSHIEEVQRKLAESPENSPEAEEALRELTQLNRLKVSLSNHLGRTII